MTNSDPNNDYSSPSKAEIRLLVIRHGNTFDKGDTVRRVGSGTDLPLSQSGREQARKLGAHLQAVHPEIDAVYTGTLKRTKETADIACQFLKPAPRRLISPIFDEIHYGPDEGQPEDEVVARVGKETLVLWEKQCIPPPDWHADPEELVQRWQGFLKSVQHGASGTTVAVVTSNGIARFLLKYLEQTGAESSFPYKLSTAAYGELVYHGARWRCEAWNQKP
jgi:broad specificity phosphatase PhoE